MKIRTDFVTNSSSSSFCVMTVKLKDKPSIQYMCEDGATPPFGLVKDAKNKLQAMTNIEQLVAFLCECDHYPEDLEWDEDKAKFFEAVKQIQNIDDVVAVSLNYGEWDSEDWDEEDEPDGPEGYGGSFEYDFKTKSYKESCEIDPDVSCPFC